jgi:hypothetical protein
VGIRSRKLARLSAWVIASTGVGPVGAFFLGGIVSLPPRRWRSGWAGR